MKKIICAGLALLMCGGLVFSVTACSGSTRFSDLFVSQQWLFVVLLNPSFEERIFDVVCSSANDVSCFHQTLSAAEKRACGQPGLL